MKFNYQKIFSIFFTSLKLAFKWSPLKWISTGGIAVLVSLVVPIGKEYFEWDSILAISYCIIGLLMFLTLRLFIIFFKEVLKYYHEVYQNSIYGEAIILLKDSFGEAHYYRKTPGYDEESFMKSMMVLCNNLKTIFDSTTKSNCSVSIKVPVSDDVISPSTELKNLTRDVSCKSRDTDDYNDKKHTIIGNTAFSNCLNKVITNKTERFYVNNNVNNQDNYENTSKDCYENGILPYNSELVYPITPLKSVDNTDFNCHGFICIDSQNENAFENRYGPAILEGVADGIYDIILELNQQMNGSSS